MSNVYRKIWLWWVQKYHPDIERLSTESKMLFERANAIAASQGSSYIDSLHLLEAAIESPLGDYLDPERKMQEQLRSSSKLERTEQHDRLKKALEYSITHARESGAREITPPLLLLGLLDLQDSPGAKLMQVHGINRESLLNLMI